jgi:hypothetical protein
MRILKRFYLIFQTPILISVAILLFALFGLCCTNCTMNYPPFQPEKVENIGRLMSSGSGYTIFIEDEASKQLIQRTIPKDYGDTVIVLMDCAPDKKMWFSAEPDPKRLAHGIYTLHIHDASEIGAGRTGGKFPQQKHIIE